MHQSWGVCQSPGLAVCSGPDGKGEPLTPTPLLAILRRSHEPAPIPRLEDMVPKSRAPGSEAMPASGEEVTPVRGEL